jgi:hypothetical protein
MRRFSARSVSDFTVDIPPVPQINPLAISGDPKVRVVHVQKFNAELREWREKLASMPSAFAGRVKPTGTSVVTTTVVADAGPSSSELADLQSQITGMSSFINGVLNGPYHRFKANGTLQLKNPATGLYYTVLGFDGTSISMDTNPEA